MKELVSLESWDVETEVLVTQEFALPGPDLAYGDEVVLASEVERRFVEKEDDESWDEEVTGVHERRVHSQRR